MVGWHVQVMAKEDEAIAASLALLHTVDLADDAVNCVCWSKDGTQVRHDTTLVDGMWCCAALSPFAAWYRHTPLLTRPTASPSWYILVCAHDDHRSRRRASRSRAACACSSRGSASATS